MSWKTLGWVMVGLGTVLGVIGAAGQYTPFIVTWNRTPSFPIGAYAGWKSEVITPLRGQLVLTNLTIPTWAEGRGYSSPRLTWLKRIMGLPGDQLYVTGDQVWICPQKQKSCLAGGRLHKQDSQGRTMVWPTWNGEKIPEGYFYAYAPAEKSFDSRYVGLQPLIQLKAPLWGGLTDAGYVTPVALQ